MWKSSEQLRKIAPYLNLGTVFTGCTLIGVGLGYWLDKKLGTEPWLLLLGAVLGIISGFYHFIKTVLQLQKSETGRKTKDEKEGQTSRHP